MTRTLRRYYIFRDPKFGADTITVLPEIFLERTLSDDDEIKADVFKIQEKGRGKRLSQPDRDLIQTTI